MPSPDVTGFGLIGHALEMAIGANLVAEINIEAPAAARRRALLRAGVRTGASTRNWDSYGDLVQDLAASTTGGATCSPTPDQWRPADRRSARVPQAVLAWPGSAASDEATVVGPLVGLRWRNSRACG
jgi:selenide,water dikinase